MMPAEYHQNDLADKTLTCPNCHWEGPAQEAAVIDFYGVSATQEIHCPACDTLIGILKKDDPPGKDQIT